VAPDGNRLTVTTAIHARDVFGEAGGCANDLGLVLDGADSKPRTQLRNVPLAVSHAGLVRAAVATEEAEQREGSRLRAVA
jgi:hypothetical protein